MDFVFGDAQVDLTVFELRRDGVTVPVEPQVFDVLVYLLRHRDRVVSKEELMDQVWGGRFVSETAVTSRIKQVRRALGDDGRAQRVIRTVHGRGYRFVAPVAETSGERGPASDGAAEEPPPVRYTVCDGLHIAYQVTGSGPRDIVLVSGFISHLEQDWEDPRHARFLDRLGSLGRLIRFDKRGTGMSDRPEGLPDLETRMHDVLAVLDAAGSRRAVLCGYSEGGPMEALFAATHPERASSLVLYGTYAKRTRVPDYPWAADPAERAAYTEQLVSSWDWEADLRMRCPSADDAMARWWARRARAATTPGTVRRLMDMNALVDVRDVLPAVRVPTLVVHRTGDSVVSVEEARYIAQHVRGAELVELPGADHFVSGDPDQIVDAIEAFLTRRSPTEPVPTTLALAAIVAVAGDDVPGSVEVLARAGGRPRRAPAGRQVVLFDGPATAIRAGVGLLGGQRAAARCAHRRDRDRQDVIRPRSCSPRSPRRPRPVRRCSGGSSPRC